MFPMQFALRGGTRKEMPIPVLEPRNLDIEQPRRASDALTEVVTKDILNSLLDVMRDLKVSLENNRRLAQRESVCLSGSSSPTPTLHGLGSRTSFSPHCPDPSKTLSPSSGRSVEMAGIPPEIMTYVRRFGDQDYSGDEARGASELLLWLDEFEDNMSLLGLDGSAGNGLPDKRPVVARLALKGKALKAVLTKRAGVQRQGRECTWADMKRTLRLTYQAQIPEYVMESRLCQIQAGPATESTALLMQRVLEVMDMADSKDPEYRLFYLISKLPDETKNILLRRPCPEDEVELINRVEQIEYLRATLAMDDPERYNPSR
ncbi:hypothetical protein IWQ60_010747 [Tieghemiomyces parasiticus]|uniref:Uncharacterized protein n=1 Tax=Tieghemiomyces parasiticus TaxID=78921 RepID=A0A9W8DMI5_9FUNG|nr:hypothetical protein IWQ60_010747 [Tieghemiomyces parasiticus]